jgi:hypothetical protein
MSEDMSILIRIDKLTKAEMARVKINWSEEIRNFIKRRITKEKNLALAVTLMEKVLSSQKYSNTDSTEMIRKFRDERYGPNSRRR